MNLQERLTAARANLSRYRIEAEKAKDHYKEKKAWRDRSTSAKEWAKMDLKVQYSKNALELWNRKIEDTKKLIEELKRKINKG